MAGHAGSWAAARSVWARRAASVAEGAIAAAAIVVIAACLAVLGVLVFDSARGERWTSGLRPVQFYKELDAELLDDYGEVFAVAHNSGDGVRATLDALWYDADVVEVDVVSLDGRLYAAHDMPRLWIGGTVFRGPPLAQVWIASAGAAAVKLDLKENSPAFHESVLRFLADRRGQRRVIVVSGDPDALRLYAEQEPAVLRFFSPGDDDRLRLLDKDPAFAAIVDGISLRHSLIDAERAAWLEERGLLTLAWTVNDLGRVSELVRLGVDAITTDNLAIMKLLGGQERGARRLDLLRATAPPVEQPVPAAIPPPVQGLAAGALTGAGAGPGGRARSRARRRPAPPRRAERRRSRRAGVARPGRSWRRRRASARPARTR